VQRLLLLDARTGERINEVGNGSTFSTNQLPSIDIEAVTSAGRIGSVVFFVNGERRNVDSTAPFTLSGQESTANVDLPVGEVTIRAVPFVNNDGTGPSGASLSSTFMNTAGGTGEGGEDDSEFEVEGEAETEAESEVTVSAVQGIAGSSQAHGASAAASGNNAVAETAASGSLSISTNVSGAAVPDGTFEDASTSELGRDASGADHPLPAQAGNRSPDQKMPMRRDQGDGPSRVSILSAEAEAEAETETEVEVGVGAGSAVANAGSSAAGAAVGANIYLREDALVQPIAMATQTAIDTGSSTSTSTADVMLDGMAERVATVAADPAAAIGVRASESRSTGRDADRTSRATDAAGTAPAVASVAVIDVAAREAVNHERYDAKSPFATAEGIAREIAGSADQRVLLDVETPTDLSAGDDLILAFTGIDIDSHKELSINVGERSLGTLSTFGTMPSLGLLDRFRAADEPAPIAARIRIPAEVLAGDAEITFRHWHPSDSWDVVDVDLQAAVALDSASVGSNGLDESGSGAILAPGANGTGTENINILDANNGSGSLTSGDDGNQGNVPNRGSDTTLPADIVFQLDAEGETETETEIEAEVATGPATAAAGATGASVVAAAGDFAAMEAWLSTATSTSASPVTDTTPSLYLQTPEGSPMLARSGARESGANGGESPLLRESPALAGMGTNEANAEAESEAKAVASVSNGSAAAAAIGAGGAGASGIGAGGRISAASSVSTSTEGARGEVKRRNDEFTNGKFRYEGQVDFLGAQAEAEAETEASVDPTLQLEPGFVNVGPQSVANTAVGDAGSESFVRLSGYGSTFLDSQLQGTRSLPPRDAPERIIAPMPDDGDLMMGDGVVGDPGSLEIEVESESRADVEVETGFNSAAAAAAASSAQAENGYILTPAEAASATSTSTSVLGGESSDNKMRDLPGPAPEGERGGFPAPTVQSGGLVFEVETEAEAEAEVGFVAGAAAAASSASGKRDVQADTRVASSPFAAASAAASGAIVFLDVRLPPDGEAGLVIATARAEDPACNGVAVAVAVAGVPNVSGQDNEDEAAAEDVCVAIVTVEVFTDPDDALTPLLLNDVRGSMVPTGGANGGISAVVDNEPEPFESRLESEGEAESEAEAEAGYGVAAAGASSSSAGIFSTADAKTSTSTLPYNGGYEF